MATQRDGIEDEPGRPSSLRRGLAVLEALALRPEGATPKELSRDLGLHISTCYRLLNALVATGYAGRGRDGLFRVGARVAFLHHGYLMALRPPPGALPFVHALQLATTETVVLSQLEGDDAVITTAVAGSHLEAVPPGYVGIAAPAHALATGQVLLSGLPAPQLEAYLTRHTNRPGSLYPLSDPHAFRADLERIRRDGYALGQGHGHNGICCIAAPVIDPSGDIVAAIAVLTSQAGYQRDDSTLLTAILTVAHAISALQLQKSGARDRADGSQTTIEAAVTEIAAAMSRVGLEPVRKVRRVEPSPGKRARSLSIA